MIAKYLATSLAIEKVVSAPLVMRSCLPISTTSMSLVGLESRSTMLPASLAATVPVFMATPTSAWARAGASLMPPPVTSHKASEFPPWAGTWLPAGDLVLDGGQVATVSFDRDGRCRLLLALDRPAEVEDVTALEEAADALPYLRLNDLEG